MRGFNTPIYLFVFLFFAATAIAVTPESMNFQGQLNGSDGQPVSDGDYQITFSIWDDSVGGIQYWSETRTVSTYSGGVTVSMGDVNSIDVDSLPDVAYLQLQVFGDPPMMPRIPLSSAPYSFFAKRIIGDIDMSSGFLRVKDSESDPVDVTLEAFRVRFLL